MYIERVLLFEVLNRYLHEVRTYVVYLIIHSLIHQVRIPEYSSSILHLLKNWCNRITLGDVARLIQDKWLLGMCMVCDELCEGLDTFEMDFLSTFYHRYLLERVDRSELLKILEYSYRHGLRISKLFHVNYHYNTACNEIISAIRKLLLQRDSSKLELIHEMSNLCDLFIQEKLKILLNYLHGLRLCIELLES